MEPQQDSFVSSAPVSGDGLRSEAPPDPVTMDVAKFVPTSTVSEAMKRLSADESVGAVAFAQAILGLSGHIKEYASDI